MNYPVWDVPLIGGGLVIAVIAILHAFVSQFAVGGGLFLPLIERKAYREGDAELLDYSKHHSKFFLLITIVWGAVTGVGIWFSIGLVSPAATSTLIHSFVWGWALEWDFFLLEIAAILIYYYTWDRVDRKTHMFFGWVYFVAAWLSLAIITGILAFMLTPGRWLETHEFWDGFLNPSYLPSVFVRTGVSFTLAGLYAFVTLSRMPASEFKERTVKWVGTWFLPGALLILFAGVWYIAVIPAFPRELTMGGAPMLTMWAALSVVLSILLFGFVYFGPYKQPNTFTFPWAILLLFIGLGATTVTEFTREGARKPYLIHGYMYSNGILESQKYDLYRDGVLPHAKWVRVKKVTRDNVLVAGEEIFKIECKSCHKALGYNGLKPVVRGWDSTYTDGILRNLDILKGFMPPFMGTDDERAALVTYLTSLNPPQVRAVRVRPGNLVESGRDVFNAYCLKCHTTDSYNPLRPKVAGYHAAQIDSLVQHLPDLRGDMPAFPGSAVERGALAAWLVSLNATK